MLRSLLRKHNLFFSLLYVCYYASYSAFYVFMVSYFKQVLGFGDFAASFAPTCTMLATLLGQPVLGYLADTYIPIKRLMIGMLGLALPTALLLMNASGAMAFVLMFILSVLDASGFSLFDSWIMRLKAAGDTEIEYGLIKAIAALGGGFLAMFISQQMNAYGYTFMFYAHMGLIATVIVLALFISPVDCPNRHGSGAEKKSGISYGKALGLLIHNRPYVIIVLSILFTQFANRAAMGFLARIVLELGGNSGHTGTASLISALTAFVTTLVVSELLRRGKRMELILAIGLGVGVLRYGILTLNFTLTVFLITHALNGICSGCWNRIWVEFVSDVTPRELTSTAVTIASAVATGIGGVVGSVFGGWVMEAWGVRAYVGCVTVVSVLAMLVALINVRDSSRKRQAVQAS